jgi:hypothetical protein
MSMSVPVERVYAVRMPLASTRLVVLFARTLLWTNAATTTAALSPLAPEQLEALGAPAALALSAMAQLAWTSMSVPTDQVGAARMPLASTRLVALFARTLTWTSAVMAATTAARSPRAQIPLEALPAPAALALPAMAQLAWTSMSVPLEQVCCSAARMPLASTRLAVIRVVAYLALPEMGLLARTWTSAATGPTTAVRSPSAPIQLAALPVHADLALPATAHLVPMLTSARAALAVPLPTAPTRLATILVLATKVSLVMVSPAPTLMNASYPARVARRLPPAPTRMDLILASAIPALLAMV